MKKHGSVHLPADKQSHNANNHICLRVLLHLVFD